MKASEVERIGTLDTISDSRGVLTNDVCKTTCEVFFVESLDITKSPGSQIQEILNRTVMNVDPEK